jgi:hypothetical protein
MSTQIYTQNVTASGGGEAVFVLRTQQTEPAEVVVAVTSGGPATFALFTVPTVTASPPNNSPVWAAQPGLGSVSAGSSGSATVIPQMEGWRVTWSAAWVGTISVYA